MKKYLPEILIALGVAMLIFCRSCSLSILITHPHSDTASTNSVTSVVE